MCTKTSLFLFNESVSDIEKSIGFAVDHGCDAIITPITHQKYKQEFNSADQNIVERHLNFSRSDLIMMPSVWMNKVITKLSRDVLGCDSNDINIRKHAEALLSQEVAYANHCQSSAGSILVELKGTKTVNLARMLRGKIAGTLLAEVPMVDPKTVVRSYASNSIEDEEDTWQWWNKFRSYADYNFKFRVALELSADIPSEEEILRWLGEPVDMLIIPADIFINNSKNYPVLSKAHQSIVSQFLNMNLKLGIKANVDDGKRLKIYVDYIKHLIHVNKKPSSELLLYEDVLEIPLQPLYNDLDAYTYEVFERDPVKYKYYQNAIEAALKDKIPEKEIDSKTAVVMVLGAGRGPLVRAAINASKNTKRKIKIKVVEKNANAIVTLNALKQELWQDEDLEIYSRDMRYIELDEKADIIISELLGSFGDNELSPECLDGAQRLLKEDGISIPCKSTSYLNPIMSQKLLNAVKEVRPFRHREYAPSTYEVQSECTYVVHIKTAYHIADPKKVFEFVHPNRDAVINNARFIELEFDVLVDCVLTGFAGYFDAVLYKDIKLSTHPTEHSQGMASWFSIYFPLAEPQHVRAGEKIKMNMWRSESTNKVWYEWNTLEPNISHIHNFNGEACPIYK